MNSEYLKRLENYQKTVRCEKTDYVVTAPQVMYLPVSMYQECTIQQALEDYEQMIPSGIRYHVEFQPDMAWGLSSLFPVKPAEILGCTYARWPGKHFTDSNKGFQILDHEYMTAEEYLEFAEDPTGFMLKKIAPRQYANLEGLSELDFSDFMYRGLMYDTIAMTSDKVKSAFATMERAGEAMKNVAASCSAYADRLRELGWPMVYDITATAPFDAFNDSLRGLINITMDMIECPDELLVALEAKTKIQTRRLRQKLQGKPEQTVIFFIHNGMDSFMSLEQFEVFCWPGLKACIDVVLEMGCVPRIYLEGDFQKKLDLFVRDLPIQKCIFSFVDTDMEKVKEKFAGKICIAGGVDGVLLQYGTKEDVIKNVKHMIDICAPGGGYIIDTTVSLDAAKKENLQALFDTAHTYMKY